MDHKVGLVVFIDFLTGPSRYARARHIRVNSYVARLTTVVCHSVFALSCSGYLANSKLSTCDKNVLQLVMIEF